MKPVSFTRAAVWSLVYIILALLFGLGLGVIKGWDLGGQFLAGYIVEKSLSIDNLFVFVIIIGAFAVPPEAQPRALNLGVGLALVLRAIFIAAGAALLDAFSFMFAVFGLVLIVTSVQLFRHRDQEPSVSDNPLVAIARRRLPLTEAYDGRRLVTMEAGQRRLTPMFLALIAIGTTDVLFALDSIPAVFGITNHAWIVLAANVFALLGLRPLYFLVAGLLDRLVYLSTGLAVILAFIGVKLLLHFGHLHNDRVSEIPTAVSLVVIVLILSVTTAASIHKTRHDRGLRAKAGALRRTDREADPQIRPGRPRYQDD